MDTATMTMDDHYTIEQLRARGWTGSMIKAHLGKPDKQRSDPNGRLRKMITLYRTERVHALEVGAAKAELQKLSDATSLVKRALEMRKKKLST